jgi:2'-5' RNA ligase
MRLFIALELEPAVREWLRLIQEQLRRDLEARWIRWVQPDNIHLTLKFLGEVEGGKVKGIAEALEAEASRHGPCAFSVAGVGAFPNPERARVVWVGMRDSAGSLAALHKGIESALDGMGFEREGRRFTPHLTLGRVRDGLGREALARLTETLKTPPGSEPLASSSGQVILVQSELRPEGAVYATLSCHRLRGNVP